MLLFLIVIRQLLILILRHGAAKIITLNIVASEVI